jgi:hypothetical protein
MKVGKLGSLQQEDIEFNSIGIIKVLRSRSTLQTIEAIKALPRL